jgi:hypothetical protein
MITLFPVGGLCNRIRSIDSGMILCRRINRPLRIIWQRDETDLNCKFSDLFDSIPAVDIIEDPIPLRYQGPRKRNLFLPLLYRKLFVDKVLTNERTGRLVKAGYNFESLAQYKTVFLINCFSLFKEPTRYEQFQPIHSLASKIDAESTSFNEHTFGVHIRRTDNIASIEHSDLTLFVQAISRELERNADANFFLATDCKQTKEKIVTLFGNKVITRNETLERTTTAGIQNALIDLYLLSKTERILGSFWSSFSETAAAISGVNVTFVTKELVRDGAKQLIS